MIHTFILDVLFLIYPVCFIGFIISVCTLAFLPAVMFGITGIIVVFGIVKLHKKHDH